jgi:hypothetical protein
MQHETFSTLNLTQSFSHGTEQTFSNLENLYSLIMSGRPGVLNYFSKEFN